MSQAPRPMPGIHHDWGRAPYGRIHAWMERLVEERALGRIPNLLLTGEHEAVITLGRKTPPGAPYPSGVPVLEVERGGEATWHGPGQLVAYPIAHLTEARRDLHRFQRDLEEVGIATLSDFGIEGGRREGLTGVWVGERKVQSLGIAVRRWVTWHGLALNVDCALSDFASFTPCGLDGAVMGSMAALLGREVSLAQVRERLVAHAGRLLPGGPFLPGAVPLAASLGPAPGRGPGAP
jgi:lipoate-protein ligase B